LKRRKGLGFFTKVTQEQANSTLKANVSSQIESKSTFNAIWLQRKRKQAKATLLDIESKQLKTL
jgi:hypothetical protein